MTLLWAALISIATTLVMEWFAKPTLEARKERILEQHRTRRRIIAIAIENADGTEDYYVHQKSSGDDELVDEYRSLRATMKPVRGRREREAIEHMDDAIKELSHRHPMDQSGIAYLAAKFLNEPRWHLRNRKATFSELLAAVNDKSHL